MTNFKGDNKAGLYLTISFHLIVLIVLLATTIYSVKQTETTYIFDFSQLEELEEQIRILELKESVSDEINQLLRQSRERSVDLARNVIVNESRTNALKDDRSTDPNEVYNEAQRLQERLDAARRQAEAMENSDAIAIEPKTVTNNVEAYKGPSVLSYKLDGRTHISLPIPAYKCIAAGDVTVAIIVDRKGYVSETRIVDPISSEDICIREYAMLAASRSRFSLSQTAPERQAGEITYRFIAQ